MRELTSVDEVRSASADDALIMWGAQGMKPGIRAWAAADAVAVAAPGLFRRDRIIVLGDPAPAAALVRHALAECGPTFRVLGDEHLVRALTERLPELDSYVTFDWMDTGGPIPPGPDGAAAADGRVTVRWLAPDEDPKVADLLEVASPTSWAQPGLPGVRRWAGAWRDGELVACAADAWSAPTVGLIAGVATAPAHRGRRYAEAVCRHVATALLAAHGRVALMVDADNHAAIRVYTRLGLTRRGIAAARLADHAV
ncbi:MAG: GNAT family N-acetyltransferase [Actinomycetes bacterium]